MHPVFLVNMHVGFSWDEAHQRSPVPSQQRTASISSSVFRKLKKVGFGTYGDIFLATRRNFSEDKSKLFALKKFRFSDDSGGISRSAIREIRLLRDLTGHANIVDCYGLLVSSGNDSNKGMGSLYLVLGFVEHDLVGLLELHKRKLTVGEVKSIFMQTLLAVDYCHYRGVVHRDLKCANILISREGVVKLADFGLAREFCADPSWTDGNEASAIPMTNKVITLWYRPPELLAGATLYGPEVDLWSLGAILAELLLQRPLFSAEREFQVLKAIVDELGPVTSEEDAMYYSSLPFWNEVNAIMGKLNSSGTTASSRAESAILQSAGATAWNLVSQFLTYLPSTRISAGSAIEHAFFNETPLPCDPRAIRLPTAGGEFCHQMAMKEKREKSKADNGDPAKRFRTN